MSSKNLLIAIVDTNPLWWGLQSSGLIPPADSDRSNGEKATNGSSKNKIFTLSDFISATVGFLNVYKTLNQNNAIAVIAAHNTKAEYIYPTRDKYFDKSYSPWERFEQIGDVDEQVRQNLKALANEQIEALNADHPLSNDSMITSAIGMALCYVNRIQRKFTFTEEVNYRILVLKACDDSANQYMNFMNTVFTAEKLNVIIDSCVINQDSSLLQQACNLTNGFYFKVPQVHGLLQYLLWLYLPEHSTRKMLVYPPKTHVDFRAACFCHRKLIDVGYVCSVCLSVFCAFTPICSTCNCNFQFDVNIFKRATSLKQGSFALNKFPATGSIGSSAATSLKIKSISNVSDECSTSSLANHFQDASISSPMAPLSVGSINNPASLLTSSQFEPFENTDTQAEHPAQVKIITAVTSSKSGSSKRVDLNDSLENLE